MSTRDPHISIIVPVHNGAAQLRRCLTSLLPHVPPGTEIIVVDDSSTDSSAAVGLSMGCRVLHAETRSGPGAARNLGAEAANGEILVFLDSDVCVHADTIEQLVAPLCDDTVGAVFGSYDSEPDASHLISRFRNLLHHYVHQTARTEAASFWAGCGAVRKRLFESINGFDAIFASPSVEDIDLGLRLHQAGHRIVVNKHALVKHLKRWTLRSMCSTDLWRRGVPWSQLVLRGRRIPNDLNLKHSQRVSVLVAFVLVAVFFFAAWSQPWFSLLPLVVLVAIQIMDAANARSDFAAGAAIGFTGATFGAWLAVDSPWAVALGALGACTIWLANLDFYRFLSRSQGEWFAVAVFPLHLIFYLICGVAFLIATGQCLGIPDNRLLRQVRQPSS